MTDDAYPQPQPRDPDWPRYSTRPFHPYRFVPRAGRHPYRHPKGHSHGQGLPDASAFPPEAWQGSEEYRFGIDLYNHAYWWEAHEILEEIWHRVGHDTLQGQFLQGLIQLAAGLLHRFGGRDKPFRVQVCAGLDRMRQVPDHYMGVDVARLRQEFEAILEDPERPYPLIRLEDREAG